MTQKFIPLKDQLAAIANSGRNRFEPKIKSFEKFNTLEALCAEIAGQLDREAPHDGLEPYCGIPLARAMISLCKQLSDFRAKPGNSSDDNDTLIRVLAEYITGAKPFICLSEAYKLSSELNSFLSIYSDHSKPTAAPEISEEAYDDVPDDPYGCFVEFEDYEDPLAWMFPDEESCIAYRVAVIDAKSVEDPYDDEDEDYIDCRKDESSSSLRQELYEVINSGKVVYVIPFAQEIFLAKAIECCTMRYDKFYDAGLFEFPFDDFSPENRKRIEEQSNDSFVKLYDMIVSENGLKAGIENVNRALKSFEDLFIRRYSKRE